MRPQMLTTLNPTRRDWLAARRLCSVTASDVAVLMGVTPWCTPQQLLAERVAEADRSHLDLLPHIFFGQRLEEPTLRAWAEWERAHGVPTWTKHNRALWANPERPWFGATPDGLARRLGTTGVVEVKRPRFFSMRKWATAAPAYYEWQVRAQLYVMAQSVGFLVGHCDAEPICHTISWRESEERAMLAAVDRFHTAVVAARR